VVAYFEPSVLKTLLLADLLASAAVVPTLLGLYTKKANGAGAAIATICGIATGMPFYIRGSSLPSFGLALIVSTVVILISMIFSKSGFDYNRLRDEISAI
jgi:Na+/proline symporter